MNALSISPRFLDDDSTLLNRFACDLSEVAELSAILEKTAAVVRGVLSCDECGIYLIEGNDLVLRTSSRRVIPRRIMGAARIVRGLGWTGAQPQIVQVPEFASRDPLYRMFAKRTSRNSIDAFLASPMVSGGRVTGIILAQSYAPQHFSKEQLSLIGTVTTLAALGVELVRLKDENASLALRFESCNDIEQATRILATEHGLDIDRAYVLLQQESRRRRKPMREMAAAILLTHQIAAPPPEIPDTNCLPSRNPKSLSQ